MIATALPNRSRSRKSNQSPFASSYVFAALAEEERRLIAERTRAGLPEARKRSVRLGNAKKTQMSRLLRLNALHCLRKVANAILHLEPRTEEAFPKLETSQLEMEIISLFGVLRALIEGARQWTHLRARQVSHK